MTYWSRGLTTSVFAAFLATIPNGGYADPVKVKIPVVPINNYNPLYTAWGRIGSFETGWVEDTLAVFMTDIAVVNPGRCKVSSSYALDPSEAGNHTHQAALMGAYFNGKSVRLLVQGCIYDKPRIIGVGVRD